MRRAVFFVLIASLSLFAFLRWERNGAKSTPLAFTPAAAPKLALKDVQMLTALDGEYTKLVNSVVPSVVSVATARKVQVPLENPWDQIYGRPRRTTEGTESALGSGVIVSKEGHILTNHHVIANMQEIRVQLTDGRVLPAKLVGSDENVDIAVLKIDAPGLEPLSLGDSDQVRVGQMVFAIGNPFGLQETVTQGIVSAKGRALQDHGIDFLQTDAAVNPGNSGGPLLNVRGEIIGINSAIYSQTGGWAGISFAIPSNVAKTTLDAIIRTGKPIRAYLGVSVMPLNPALVQQFGLSGVQGVMVVAVQPGSPAEQAGVRPHDVITTFNERPISDPRALRDRISQTPLGGKAELRVIRENKEITISTRVAEMPENNSLPAGPEPAPLPGEQQVEPDETSPQKSNALSGVEVGIIPASMVDRLPANTLGVMVIQIQPDAPAAGRIHVGDVIEAINNRAIRTPDEFKKAVEALPPDTRAVLYVTRGRLRSFMVVNP